MCVRSCAHTRILQFKNTFQKVRQNVKTQDLYCNLALAVLTYFLKSNYKKKIIFLYLNFQKLYLGKTSSSNDKEVDLVFTGHCSAGVMEA
jgi:hypothetical protein